MKKNDKKGDAPKGGPLGLGGSSFELTDGRTVFRELRLKTGKAFLDIASGRGAYTLAASEFVGPGGRLYAVDLWKDGIAELKAAGAARGIRNLVAKVADVGKRIPFGDRTVDRALMATVLHDLVEEGKAEKALQETARVLKPDGVFAVVEFKKKEGPPGPPRAVRLNPREVENLVAPFGFRRLKVKSLSPKIYLVVFQRIKQSAE